MESYPKHSECYTGPSKLAENRSVIVNNYRILQQ